jgi:hypothetical protein
VSDVRWISVAAAARKADFSVNYFREKYCFPNDGLPRSFRIREFPNPSGRRRILVDEASLEAWLRSLDG